VVDDAAFHGSAFSMRDFENSCGNVYLTHLGGMITQINPFEYIINALRRKYNRLPNATIEEAFDSLFKCM
jgi:hypothetical protein